MQIINELTLSKDLIKFPSITPVDAGAIKFLSKKLKSIGFHFGGRDHSTVIHAVQSVNDMIDTDSIFKKNVEEIKKRISV